MKDTENIENRVIIKFCKMNDTNTDEKVKIWERQLCVHLYVNGTKGSTKAVKTYKTSPDEDGRLNI